LAEINFYFYLPHALTNVGGRIGKTSAVWFVLHYRILRMTNCDKNKRVFIIGASHGKVDMASEKNFPNFANIFLLLKE